MEHKPRIALLIDADNSPASAMDLILNELSGFGETSIRRAYGNWTKDELKGWAAILHEQAIRPMQQYDYSRGKNASDMALTVDAMALLYTDRPDAFAIVSSDADFTPLVMHIREKGLMVLGFGAQKTPEPFVSACSRFLFLDQLQEQQEEDAAPQQPAPGRVPTAALRQDAKLVRLLRAAVRRAADEDGWASVSAVGQYISNQSSFDPRNYGYSTYTKLLKASQLFDMRDEGTSSVAVLDPRSRDAAE